MKTLHAVRWPERGNWAWPLCPSARYGRWHIASGRLTSDPERVTCLRCLDILTRPSSA